MSAWRSMEDAPRDGQWVVLDVEVGGDVYEPLIGRWAPKYFADLRAEYQWEVFQPNSRPPELFNHWSEGRIARWQSLPELSKATGEAS